MSSKNPTFDLFRSIAIILVLFGHYYQEESYLSNFSDLGVDIFFVLSGYLVTQSFYNPHYQNNPKTHFIINRIFKILPSYFAFFIVTVLLFNNLKISDFENYFPKVNEFKQYIFFYRNFGGPPPRLAFEHLWSLSAEVQFYLILFLSFILFKSKRAFLYFWTFVFAVSVFIKVQAIFTSFIEWPTYTHNRIDAFAIGLILFLSPAFFSKLKINKYLLITILIILGAMHFHFDSHKLLNRTLAPICIAILLNYKQLRSSNFIFGSISKYSYNLYLWHFPILIWVQYYYNSFELFHYLVYSIITSIIFTEIVELQFLKYKQLIIRMLKKQ